MPLTLEPRGIQAPKQFGDRNNTFARQPMQLHGAAVVNHMDDNRRSSGYQQTESGARSNRSGREDGFARGSGAVVNGSVGKIQLVVADPIEMRNVRVTFQNTRQVASVFVLSLHLTLTTIHFLLRPMLCCVVVILDMSVDTRAQVALMFCCIVLICFKKSENLKFKV
jgi:hypothetical protein